MGRVPKGSFAKNQDSNTCSLGLSATSQQYYSLRTNQTPATSQQYFSPRTNQHQISATSETNGPEDSNGRVLIATVSNMYFARAGV
jgi:hypothetical protein